MNFKCEINFECCKKEEQQIPIPMEVFQSTYHLVQVSSHTLASLYDQLSLIPGSVVKFVNRHVRSNTSSSHHHPTTPIHTPHTHTQRKKTKN
jgi:hypothetical protein